ncbi:hypothetical protein BH24DEI1_BH24DEI1_07880 [soil metagenome]
MRASALVAGLLLLWGQASAFQWEPFVVPPGEHRYVVEVRTVAEGEDDGVSTITINVREAGEGYRGETTIAFSQENVSAEELSTAMFGGSMLGTFAFGPMMMFGPTFMMLPMMLMGEEIRVRPEPLVVMGMGRLHMDSTVEAAGRDCVLLRFESGDAANASEDIMEFALAEDLPFPCYARYGSPGSYTEIRMLEAD